MSLVTMRDVYKKFGEVFALRGVNFDVEENEVVGLIGDNGAGKSTLIKILSGVHRPTGGELRIRGERVNLRRYSVREAHRYGIEPVFQEQALADKQSLWRNLFLGREITGPLGFLKSKEMIRETDSLMSGLLKFTGGGMAPQTHAMTLSGGERQGLAIGRAMYFEAELIILDEPTRALSVKEIGKVLRFVKELKENGKSCVYISHTISHVYAISDRFVILDRGEIVGEYRRDDVTEEELNERLSRAFRLEESPE